MAEFASKGVAGAGLGLGIAGTAGFLLNGGLNNILGGGVNQTYVDSLQARVAELTAEKYSNAVAVDAYKSAVGMAEKLDGKFTPMLGEVTREVADARVREAQMKAEIKCLQKEMCMGQKLTEAKINEVALVANNGLTALSGTVACIQNTLNGITKTIVPATAICPAPMPQYNSWTAPTTPTTTTPAA